MSGPFSHGVSALDEALIAEPVFKSEIGLSHRRSKLERAFAKALRAFLEESSSQGVTPRAAIDELLRDVPEVGPDGAIRESRY